MRRWIFSGRRFRIMGGLVLAVGCSHDAREVVVQVAPTTGYTFQGPTGHAVVLETAELELHAVDFLAPDTATAWLAPLTGNIAWAHGDDGGESVGSLSALGVVALDAVREVGRLDVEAEELVGATLSLGTGTRFAGTIEGVRFDVQLSETATVEATGTANTEGAVELLVDLPAVLASVTVEDENQDGSLDAADAAFTNSVSFGVVSSRAYAVRTPDPRRAEVLAIEGDRSTGEQAYADACASCHGADGEGAVGPALQGHVAGMHRADTVDVVLDGEGTMGPVQGLDPAELANGVAYLHYREW